MKRLLLVCLLGLLAACQPAPAKFKATDITGAQLGGDFRLLGHDGKPRTLADFKGKVVVLFFGYTHCPDACPTTMSELVAAMRNLGEKASKVQVLFVSVDPARDSLALLAQYVPAFHPSFLGLTADEPVLRELAARYKVVVQKVGDGDKNYSVDHSTGSYILDKSGRLRVFVNYAAGAQVFTHDLQALLNE